ncbi:ABC transporter permease [Antarcticibacterium sp. 1MA-6-2]|uniref:ABC transporter permease n=1 Tax=Antarcticibacterium sp. 1MA-6-2 TaxID=2908210 RepID=UPI001F24C82A|nr:ABC transporter permease [Antarcticibacterium sp. 1MA-6-2]UJH90991.1 ABC transporter permease [Antarcticibacterium sp. 1MA-6-2]
MFKNYLKLAARNLMKHKTFSFINIFGLAIGFICCMLISLYIFHEYSYDLHHENGSRTYQLAAVHESDGESEARPTVPAAMAGTLTQDFPEIEETTRLLALFEDDKTLLKYEAPGGATNSFYETEGFIADASFFDMFTYNFIEGNPETALAAPNTVVVTEEIARKMFGNDSALGKQIRVSSSTNGDHDYTISGVFKPHKNPSHINARFFLSVEGGNLEEFVNNSTTLVNNNMFFTYLRLKEGIDPQSLEKKFPGFIKQHMEEDLKARGSKAEFFLTPLEDIHLESRMAENVTPPGSRKYIYILASIAILTLLIACINFMNLSTSRSSKRSVEVGVRKVLGAERKTLIWQFLGESLIMSLIAYFFAVILVQFLLPIFGQVAGKEITLALDQQVQLYLAFLLIAFLTGLLAGSYPAFFLSSFKLG